MLNVGTISCVHGFDGEVVLRTCVELKRIPQFFFIEIDKTFVPFKVVAHKTKGTNFVISFEDIADRHEAAEIVKRQVFIDEERIEEFVEVSEVKIRGFKIVDEKLGEVGVVEDVETYPAHDCIVGKNPDTGKKFLIPYVDEIIKNVDYETKIVKTDLPVGLV